MSDRNQVKPRRNYTAGYAPTAAELETHEIAVNWADGIVYVKTPAGDIVSWRFAASGQTGGGGGDPLTPWSPSDLGSALALWLDADDTATFTLNGSSVVQWNDKSGNSRHASEGTAANQPTYKATDAVLGGKPSVGAETPIGTIGLRTPSLTARSWFIVAAYGTGVETQFPASPVYPTLLSGPGVNGIERAGMGLAAEAGWFSSAWAPYPFVNGAATVSLTALPMPMSILNFTGSAAVTQNWNIGCNFNTPNRSWNGPLGEIVAASDILSTEDRQKLEGYLAHKWGLTANLPAEHPYKNSAP